MPDSPRRLDEFNLVSEFTGTMFLVGYDSTSRGIRTPMLEGVNEMVQVKAYPNIASMEAEAHVAPVVAMVASGPNGTLAIYTRSGSGSGGDGNMVVSTAAGYNYARAM